MIPSRHKILAIAVLSSVALAPAVAAVPQALSAPNAYAESDTHIAKVVSTQDFSADGDYDIASISQDSYSATSLAQLKARAKALAAARKAHIEAQHTTTLRGTGAAMRSKLLADAMRYKDIVPYVFGGATPAGWDCSGYTSYVYNEALGISMYHGVAVQSTLGKKVSAADAQPGDLVIFSKPSEPNFHVGINLGNGLMLNAPEPGKNTKIGLINWDPQNTVEYVNIIDPEIGYKGEKYYSYDLDSLIANTAPYGN